MHNPASVLEKGTHKFLWDFDIQTNLLFSPRRPGLIILKDKEREFAKFVDLDVPADHRIKLKECEKKDKYLDLTKDLKKTLEYEGDNYTNCDWCFWYSN